MDQDKNNCDSRRTFLKLTAASSAFLISPALLADYAVSPEQGRETDTDIHRFLHACEFGDSETVKSMLTTDKNLVFAKDDRNRSGYALALLAGHKTIGEYLKNSGYQPDLHETILDLDWNRYQELLGEATATTSGKLNADHPIGGTGMWAAATGGAGMSIWRVYSYCGNPNINTRGQDGTVPLQQALRFPNLKIAELTAASLLSNDTDPNPLPNSDFPPLHIAIERGSEEMVEMLIRLGADLNSINKYGRNPLELAEYHGYETIVTMLKNHERIPKTCRTDRLAYDVNGNVFRIPEMEGIADFEQSNYVGSAHKNLEMLKEQAQKKPDLIFSRAATSELAIEAGAHMGRQDIVQFLAEKGAAYSLPTAVMMNDFDAVKRLLDEDPNRINARGAHDFALLWYPVIGGGHIDMMQLLLDRGAEIEHQHFLGVTALHWACKDGDIEMIEMLLAHGANINRSGRKFGADPLTPIQMANDEKVIKYLKSKGARSHSK